MTTAIAFDFGGTLFSTANMSQLTSPAVEVFVAQTANVLDGSRDHATEVVANFIELWKKRRKQAADIPERERSSADLLREALSAVGMQLASDELIGILNAFHSKEAEQFTPFPKVVETLKALAAQGKRLAIIANNPWRESIASSLRRYGVEHAFEQLVVSCDIGYRKPHPRIFEELLRCFDLPAHDIMIVGDSFIHDIETPRKMGFRTCLVDLEGASRNQQQDHVHDADVFLTEFDRILTLPE